MTKQLDSDQISYEAYNTIREVINKIETTIQQASLSTNLDSSSSLSISSSSTSTSSSSLIASPISIQFEMIVNAFIKLVTKYPKEVILLGLIDIIPILGESIISKEITHQWDIIQNPMNIIDLYIQWMSSLSVFEIQDEDHDDNNENNSNQPKVFTKQSLENLKIQLNDFEENSKSIVQTAYDNLHQMIEKYSLPKIRRYLLNDWNVKDPEEVINCTKLMKGLQVKFILFYFFVKIIINYYRVFINIKFLKK